MVLVPAQRVADFFVASPSFVTYGSQDVSQEPNAPMPTKSTQTPVAYALEGYTWLCQLSCNEPGQIKFRVML